MDKTKAEKILLIAEQLLKLQEEFKTLTGDPFTVSQNLLDTINFSHGFLTAIKTFEVKDNVIDTK